MKTDAVTTRWANALYNLAERKGSLPAVQGDLDKLAGEFASSKVRAFLMDDDVSSSEKLSKLGSLTSSFHELTRNYVELAFQRGRHGVLAGSAEAYRAEHHRREGVVQGVVESARPLEDSIVERLAASLSGDLGKKVQLTQRANPDLVGGVRIFVGAKMIDQSVTGRLESLRRKMLEAPLHG